MVAPEGIKVITEADYNTYDIDIARKKGRETKFYPVLEKLICGEEISLEDAKILSIAERYGGLDKAFYFSVLRYNSEQELFKRGVNLGLISSLEESLQNEAELLVQTGLNLREIVFSDKVGHDLLSRINYSNILVLPEQFKLLKDYNREYNAILSFIAGINPLVSALSLLEFYDFAKEKKLSNIAEKLAQTELFFKDQKARNFIAALEKARTSEILDYLQIVGEPPKKISEDLEHATLRGFYSNSKLFGLFKAKYGESILPSRK